MYNKLSKNRNKKILDEVWNQIKQKLRDISLSIRDTLKLLDSTRIPFDGKHRMKHDLLEELDVVNSEIEMEEDTEYLLQESASKEDWEDVLEVIENLLDKIKKTEKFARDCQKRANTTISAAIRQLNSEIKKLETLQSNLKFGKSHRDFNKIDRL